VDDDTHVLEFTSLSLTAAGYDVQAFSNGEQALKNAETLLSQSTPELLVLDLLGSPGGPETLARLRDVGVRAPVLWISGFAPHQVIEGPDLCPENFLQKPFTGSRFMERVANILDPSA
jgi:DNA-binding response OmpR family regulator